MTITHPSPYITRVSYNGKEYTLWNPVVRWTDEEIRVAVIELFEVGQAEGLGA